MKPTLIPYVSATVAYRLHGEWYTVTEMAALQGDTLNWDVALDAQRCALPYTAAMLARWEDRTGCKVLGGGGMKVLECPQCGQQLFKWGNVYRCKNPNCKDVQMAEKLRLFKLTFDMLCKGLVIKGRKGQEGGEA